MDDSFEYGIPYFIEKTKDKEIVHKSAEFLGGTKEGTHEIMQLRSDLYDGITSKELLCFACRQPVTICGGLGHGKGKRIHYIRHKKGEGEGCRYKDPHIDREEEIKRVKFHGQQTGPLHQELQAIIQEKLKIYGPLLVRKQKKILQLQNIQIILFMT